MTNNELEEREEAYYFCYSAILRIFGDIPDLDQISAELHLEPTLICHKGECRPVRVYHGEEHRTVYARPAKFDMWQYMAPVPEERPLDVHIQTLWTHIKPSKDYLLNLKRKYTVDVFCGYRSNCGTAGFEVSCQSLEIFTALDIPFGVSVLLA